MAAAPTSAINSTGWVCLPETLGIAAFHLNANGDTACGSIDGIHCAWVNQMNDCQRNPTRELSCGAMHKAIHGVTGYEMPGGWCNRVRTILNVTDPVIPQEPTIRPLPTTPNVTMPLTPALTINDTVTLAPTPLVTPTTVDTTEIGAVSSSPAVLYCGIALATVAVVMGLGCYMVRWRRRRSALLKSAHYLKSSPVEVTPVVVLTNHGVVQEETLDMDDEVYHNTLHDMTATLTMTSLRSSFRQDLSALAPYQLAPHKLHLLQAELDPTHTAAVSMVGIQSFKALYNGNRVVVQKRQLPASLDVQTRVGYLMLRIKLTSSYIVTMHGLTWTKPSELQLVFEAMDGGRLKDYLGTPSANLVTKLDYAIRVVEGLLYIHTKGVTHRNISSSSVYLNSRGEAKLCDFGWLREEEDFVDVYSTKRAAPEILSGLQYTVQADIFALGVLLKEMAILKAAVTLRQSQSARRGTIGSAGDSLADVIKSCLNWNPAHRPSLLHVRRALRNELHCLQT
ncbi:hypothetical protein ACHHYP_00785 [Achlya hypogyna]|uniref:Protein kinase domain-containing protein n=1 Tax=Achlya hypogyna TaxID=1202772 RepID=A0A1V9ZAF4_ACHHY|nr:hypothetical protein ACHHYP_00785 [Achlya hypogyna]